MIAASVFAGLMYGLVAMASDAKSAAISVEPAELTRRPDLIGHEVSVDDRVTNFYFHPGKGVDEIALKRTPVVFRLPPRLRYSRSPAERVVRIQGILQRENNTTVCDVTSVELLPKDIDRLNQRIAVLPAGEYENRTAWARWAEKRAADFKDKELMDRAKAVEGEAIRIEAERAASDSSKSLALARRARERQVPEPEPSALAHRAFRLRLENAKSQKELQDLLSEVAEFFHDAPTAMTTDRAELEQWTAPYVKNPAATYLSAPASVRVALDHRLWADVTEALLARRATDDPKEAVAIAAQAVRQLPDRPLLAERLLEQGLKLAEDGLGARRLDEVQALAKSYREQLHRPDRATSLLRQWLVDQREKHLSPTDAEGRITLAGQYESLIGDKATAVDLLREAWRIDPQSSELADAFRRRNFKKVNDEWVETSRNDGRDAAAPTDRMSTPLGTGHAQLKGKTRKDVKALLGEPNKVVFSASQGQVIEQWIYALPDRNQYVNFLHGGTDVVPTVIAIGSLPRRLAGSPSP